jgi:hypothetical protein
MSKEIPYWVSDTLPEHSYRLILFENDDAGAESIEMSRAEYIHLKAHLAAMRGYVVPDLTTTFEKIGGKCLDPEEKIYLSKDRQQLADQIDLARGIYRLCPEAIVTNDQDFAATLRKVALQLQEA